MFWMFKIIPDLFWWLLLLAGISGIFLSKLPLLKPYQLVVKIVSSIVVVATIFLLGMLYADNTWKQAAREMEQKVQVAEAEAKAASSNIATKVVTKTQVIRERGEETIKYIDREVVKYDTTCKIPPEFIRAHNQAATK